MAEELLSAHESHIELLSLRPGSSGIFRVAFDGDVAFEAKGAFPEGKTMEKALSRHLAGT